MARRHVNLPVDSIGISDHHKAVGRLPETQDLATLTGLAAIADGFIAREIEARIGEG
jgi:hypothetical protein